MFWTSTTSPGATHMPPTNPRERLRKALFVFRPVALSKFGMAALLIAALFSLPVLGVAWSVFQPGLGNWPHLVDTVLPTYIQNSLILMLGVGVGVFCLGVGSAWLVVMCHFPAKRFFEWALILPLAAPAYVVAYAYTDFLQSSGPVQSWIRASFDLRFGEYWFPRIRTIEGAIAVFTLTLYPYVYMLSRAAFLEQSVCALDVARSLGRSAWSSFLSIALPMARPAIVVGVALALMETLADFGTVAHFGVPTFTTGIYRTWISMGDRVAAAQLCTILLGFVLVLLVMERVSRRQGRFHQATGRYQEIREVPLTGLRAVAAFLFCALPLALGFIAPFGILLWMAMTDGHDLLSPRYIRMIGNSFSLAAGTALVAILVSIFLAYAARLEKSTLTKVANRLVGMGYAVPGTMIAVGIIIPVAAFDNAVDRFFEQVFGVSTGLLLTGSIASLIFAYLVRFLAVSLNAVQASLGKVTPNMDGAARSLGAGPIETVSRVHAPIITGGILTAGLVVFVDVMKELPATLLLRPFNFDTLAIQAYNLAKDERLTQAATPSLVIVAVGVLPVLFLSRAIMKSRPGSRPAQV